MKPLMGAAISLSLGGLSHDGRGEVLESHIARF
jgi:hypothetical protein